MIKIFICTLCIDIYALFVLSMFLHNNPHNANLGILKYKKSEKNLEVGGWVIVFFICFLCCFHVSKCFQKEYKKWIGERVDGFCMTNPSFSRIFQFFLRRALNLFIFLTT